MQYTAHRRRLKELLAVNPGTTGQRMVVYSSTNFRGAEPVLARQDLPTAKLEVRCATLIPSPGVSA